MKKLLPDQLKQLWCLVDQEQLTPAQFEAEEKRLLAQQEDAWRQALLLDEHQDLQISLLSELRLYFGGDEDLFEIRRRCTSAVGDLKAVWQERDRTDRRRIEEFYDQSQAYVYDLMWWHTLSEDNSPLAYVTALQFAQRHGCGHCLDFGAGVGAGGILFARHGLEVALAEISSPLLAFSQWRLHRRGLRAQLIDLKTQALPKAAFDFVTAMDVFEHLVDPVATLEQIGEALKPGGFLFGRFHADIDKDRPQHIVQDFGPMFQRARKLGLVEFWRDEWLWGHQVFQKPR
jgi:SAM-dependent methyltransferase